MVLPERREESWPGSTFFPSPAEEDRRKGMFCTLIEAAKIIPYHLACKELHC